MSPGSGIGWGTGRPSRDGPRSDIKRAMRPGARAGIPDGGGYWGVPRGREQTHHLATHLEVEIVQRRLQQVRVVGVVTREGHEGWSGGRAPSGRGALRETLGGGAEHRARRCAPTARSAPPLKPGGSSQPHLANPHRTARHPGFPGSGSRESRAPAWCRADGRRVRHPRRRGPDASVDASSRAPRG